MKIAKDGKTYLVRFEVGEKLPESLVDLATRNAWTSGWISGLGAVKNVTLSYFDLATKTYVNHDVEGIVELVSMTGNVSLLAGKPMWHIHVAVADRHGDLKGGHLVSLEVAVTLECWVHTGSHVVTRKQDEFSGLNLLDL